MVSASNGDNTYDFFTGKYLNEKILNKTFTHICPIGGIVPIPKSINNIPSISDSWVECNGQIINDSDSVFDGISIPDLNGENRFLRGNTESGGIGGEETHELTEDEMPSHTHGYTTHTTIGTRGGGGNPDIWQSTQTNETGSAGNDDSHNNLPPYYNIIWIMRIK